MSSCVQSLTKIAALRDSIIKCEKNIKDLPELIKYLQEEEDVILKASISALDTVLYHCFMTQLEQSGGKGVPWLLPASSSSVTKDTQGGDDEGILQKFLCWMREAYFSCREQLLCLLLHPNQSLSEISLNLLLKMVNWEGHAHPAGSYAFPNQLYHMIMYRLLDNAAEGEVLIGRCLEWLEYHDLLFFWLKNIASIVNGQLDVKKPSSIPEHFVENVYSALKLVTMPTQDVELDHFWAGTPPETQRPSFLDGVRKRKNKLGPRSEGLRVVQKYRKHFSDAWLAFLQLQLTPRMLRQVLVNLHSAVMPHLVDPRLLLDFLTSSYDYGGVVSLLALNGLFILINKYHLDYPTFYNKLYELLEPSIFHVKYTPRFFRLLDTFLSSTHLPLYLVASFIKKLSRLSLSAPPDGVVLAVVMVTNLTKRHPNCRVLLHRATASEEVEDGSHMNLDPFDLSESDFAKSNALKSSLWELKTLQSHYCPKVSKLVCDLLTPDSLTSRLETNLERHLCSVENSKDMEFEVAVGSEVALNYREPISLWKH